MTKTLSWTAWMAVAVATALGAGCGSKLPQAQTQPPAQLAEYRQLQNEGHHRGMWEHFVKALDLTADQQAKIKDLKDRMKQGDWDEKRLEFVTLISGDTVDRAKLDTFLTGVVTGFDAKIKTKVDAMVEFRNMLTPEQRQKAVTMLLDKMAKKDRRRHHRMHGHHGVMKMLGGLCHRCMWPAVGSFMLSGDESKLRAVFTTDKTVEQRVKAIGDKIMEMDKGDRLELAQMMLKRHVRHEQEEEERGGTESPAPVGAAPSTAPSVMPSAAPSMAPSAAPVAEQPSAAPSSAPASTTP